MRQILYVSKSTARLDAAALDDILNRSRHNNALDGVTGLLWSDGQRFAQVIEGDDEAIADVMCRIRADPRHDAIFVVQDKPIEQRAFGSWSMGLRRASDPADAFDDRMRSALYGAPDDVRQTFAGLIAVTG